MLEDGPAAVSRPVYLEPAEVVASPETGILYWHVERDQMVTKGALLAHITDFFGKRTAEVRSPLDGVVLYVVATPPISKGQPVACIAARAPNA
jgi:predicted deacylase